MTATAPLVIEAVYENGVLRPLQPLPLREHERVRITVAGNTAVDRNAAINRIRDSAGLLGWTGDAETVERIALDPEFSVEESR